MPRRVLIAFRSWPFSHHSIASRHSPPSRWVPSSMSRSFCVSVNPPVSSTTGSFSCVASVPASRKRSLTSVWFLGSWLPIWVFPLYQLQRCPFVLRGSSIVLSPTVLLRSPLRQLWYGVATASLLSFWNSLPLHGRSSRNGARR